jgi:hypothetical protein
MGVFIFVRRVDVITLWAFQKKNYRYFYFRLNKEKVKHGVLLQLETFNEFSDLITIFIRLNILIIDINCQYRYRYT